MNVQKVDSIFLLLIALIWVTAVLLVNPIGDFPLNDDWAYASAVRTLVESGELRLSDWTGANLIAQVLWGALFCLPFGFSFTALRLSTLVLGLVGVLATYGLLREVRASPGLALVGALSLAFSPIYFALSFTFMTDVPFAALAMVSSWFLVGGLTQDSWIKIVVGLLLACAAILIRQIGLAIPIAFATAYVLKHGLGLRRFIEATFFVAGGIALQITYETWLRCSERLPANFGKQIETLLMQLQQPWPSVVVDAAIIVSCGLLYSGLFLFPFLIVSVFWRLSRASTVLVIGFAGFIAALLTSLGKLMPLHGNILTSGGIGPDGDPSNAPTYFWIFLTFVSVVGAVLLLIGLFLSIVHTLRKPREISHTFAIVAVITAFAPLPFLGLGMFGFYDRYLLVFAPWLMLGIAATTQRTADIGLRTAQILSGTVALMGIFTISVPITHDYLALNRWRWMVLRNLMSDYRVGPENIEDSGGQFNAWYLYDDASLQNPVGPWIVGNDYLVSFSLRVGYAELRRYPTDPWMPWGGADIILQHRRVEPYFSFERNFDYSQDLLLSAPNRRNK